MTDWIVGSSILIVMIFAIRKVFGMRISSRFRYALWAVVMIRLLCPVTLWNNQQLVHNITEVSRQMFQNTSGTKVDKVDSNAELGMENGQNAGVGDASNTDRTKNDYTGNVKNQNVNMGQQNEQEINQTENLKITLGHNVFNQTGKETTAQQPEENSQSKDSNSNIFHSIIAQLISIAPAIWLYGSIAAGCWFAIVNMRFYHMLMRSRKQIDSSRKLLVYQVSGLSSPCLFGIIHPAIYLKEETKLKDDQILMILQHEICHYQHKDHIWSVMRSLCVAVWWWNPLVWAAAAESKRDCEMACDEGTLETIGWENKFLYAKTLVDAVSDKKNFGMTAASTMVSGKSDTERRLRMMLNKKKTKMASVVLAAVLMLNAAALCFGGESTAKSETQTNTAKQTALPVLAAVDVYEQIPITDDVEEFCETFGLLDKECKVDGLLPFGIAVDDQIKRIARLADQRNELLTASIGIIGVVIVHQRQVALRGQGTKGFVRDGDNIFLHHFRQNRLLHGGSFALKGKSGSRHASAQCRRYQQRTQFLNLHLYRPPSQKLHPQQTAQPGSGWW